MLEVHAGVTGSHSQMHHKMQISKEFSLNLNITLFHSLLLSPIGLKIYRWHQTLLHFKTIFQNTEFIYFCSTHLHLFCCYIYTLLFISNLLISFPFTGDAIFLEQHSSPHLYFFYKTLNFLFTK